MADPQENGTNGADSEVIEMSNGEKITFAGKRKMVKVNQFDAQGRYESTTFYFRFEVSDEYPDNVLVFRRPDDDHEVKSGEQTYGGLEMLVAMGASQKFGDAGALPKVDPKTGSPTTVEDMFESVQGTIDSFNNGVWSERREGDGLGGTSILLRALVEDGKERGKTVEDARALLKTLDAATKLSLRNSPRLKPIVERLEAARTAKSGKAAEANKVLEGW